MEMNLEILIGSLALVLSLISLYHQFFHKEIVVYPGMKNGLFYLHVENSGGTLVQDFSIEILEVDAFLSSINISNHASSEEFEEFNEEFKSRNGLNGKALNTLASKGKRTILLGHSVFFRTSNDEFPTYPILSVKVRYKGLKRSKIFTCDYNSYSNEMIDHDIAYELKELNNTLRSRSRVGF